MYGVLSCPARTILYPPCFEAGALPRGRAGQLSGRGLPQAPGPDAHIFRKGGRNLLLKSCFLQLLQKVTPPSALVNFSTLGRKPQGGWGLPVAWKARALGLDRWCDAANCGGGRLRCWRRMGCDVQNFTNICLSHVPVSFDAVMPTCRPADVLTCHLPSC